MNTGAAFEVDAQLICLNDVLTIRESVESLISNGIEKIVVVDGGSIDGTLEAIDDLPVTILSAPSGISRQTTEANSMMTKPYVFVSEADQVYEPDFVSRLLRELLESDFDGIQGRKYRDFGPGFWAKGQSLFLDVNQPPPGPTAFISGPQLWKFDVFKDCVSAMATNGSYSFDTSLSEVIRDRGVKVGVGSTRTREIGPLSLQHFLRRMRNYGEGDFHFFAQNLSRWNSRRRLQSLFHVLFRYGFRYPVKATQLGHPLIGFSFCWLVVLFRYYFWARKALLGRTGKIQV